MNGNQTHLVVGTPCYGGIVSSGFFTSTLKLQEACIRAGIQSTFLMPSGDALIPRARQDIVTYFLSQPDATHLLFIDADIGFEPEQVFRLLRFKEDVTAALYPLKKYNWEKMKAVARSGGHVESAALSYVCEWHKPGVFRDQFAKAKYVGTGFLMVRRGAFTRLIEAYPHLRYQASNMLDDPFAGSPHRYAFFNCILDEKTKTYLPEDYSFCKRWTDIGGDIWVDQRSRLDHIGVATYQGDMGSLHGPVRAEVERSNPGRPGPPERKTT